MPDPDPGRRVRLYLASTSPARLATLRAAGVEPVVIEPRVDEEAAVADWVLRHGSIPAVTMVEMLARAKAEAVATRPARSFDDVVLDGFVLGGDSAFELDGVVYGKPHRPEVARERWLLQRGRTGHLHSGHWLIDCRTGSTTAGEGRGDVTTSAVTFADDITDDEIDAYIATGEPLAVAGAFTIDSLGGPFVTRVDGDPHAVVGLSLAALRALLVGFGVHWPDLWSRPTL